MAVVGYVRVSGDKQDVENQRGEINRWCGYHKISVDKWVSEVITTRSSKRGVFELISSMNDGDTLIVTELSRIGRTLREVLGLIDDLISKKIRVVVLKENFDITDDNPMGMLMIHIVGAFYQFERSMIQNRTKEAIRTKRDKRDREIAEFGESSIIIGRPAGAKNKTTKLDGKENKIKEYLEKGMKKTEIAKILEVNRDTLYVKLRDMGIN